MLTLIEKAQQDYDAKEAEKMAEKMRENTFDLMTSLIKWIKYKRWDRWIKL
jgi:signal recognition particle GTPase